MTKDPVCGMDINENQAKAKTDYKGRTYYFCSDSCKQKFEKNPSSTQKRQRRFIRLRAALNGPFDREPIRRLLKDVG